MTGIYRCQITPDGESEPCLKRFDNVKALRTHEKMHIRRPCRWCQELFSNNGHTQPQASCTKRPEALPWEVWADLLQDLVAHAQELPEGSVCVVSTRKGAVLMTRTAAVDAASRIVDNEPVLMVPTELLPKPARAARWRRRDMDTPRDFIPETEEALEPMRTPPKQDPGALTGINWDAIQ